MMSFFCRVMIIFFYALFCFPAWALQSYIAEYALYVRGIHVGTVSYEAFFTSHSYEIATQATPTLPAKILGFNKITESVQGSIQHATVIPRYYQRDMQGDKKYHLYYDYKRLNAGEITAEVGLNTQKLIFDAKKQRPLDILALTVQSMLDDENHVISSQYTLLTDDKIRTYHVERLKNIVWKDKENKRFPVHVYLQNSGNRQTKIYFAENPLRLVELQQLKNGSLQFSLNLLNYKAL